MTNLYSMSIVNLMTNYFKKWADREDSRLRRDIKIKTSTGLSRDTVHEGGCERRHAARGNGVCQGPGAEPGEASSGQPLQNILIFLFNI